MKPALKKILIVFYLFLTEIAISQPCTTCAEDCGSGCTWSVAANSTTDYSIGSGQKLCITAGTYTGNITFSNTGGKVCVSGGNFNPASITVATNKDGVVQIGSTAKASLPAISLSAGSNKITFDNCGIIKLNGNLTSGASAAAVQINNSGIFRGGSYDLSLLGTGANFICSNDSFAAGNLTVLGTSTIYDTLYCTSITTKSSHLWNIYGRVLVSDRVTNGVAGGSGIQIDVLNGGIIVTNKLIYGGTAEITGSTSCGGIRVMDSTDFTGTAKVTGFIDICDKKGTAPTRTGTTTDPKVDRNIASFGASVTYCSCLVYLPVELLGFNAYFHERVVYLDWVTASETNNAYFTIERTGDGYSFETIATVLGAGNSSTIKNYQAIDPHPLEGISYYRLKQTDFDGTYKLSQLIAVSWKSSSNKIGVYPNPAPVGKNILLVLPFQVIDEELLNVYDVLGRRVYSQAIPVNNSTVQLLELNVQPGYYTLEVVHNHNKYSEKLIIQ